MIDKIKDLPDPLTTKEIAVFLRVNETTVRTWIRDGKLAAIGPIGRNQYRIPLEDFAAFVRARYGYAKPEAKQEETVAP